MEVRCVCRSPPSSPGPHTLHLPLLPLPPPRLPPAPRLSHATYTQVEKNLNLTPYRATSHRTAQQRRSPLLPSPATVARDSTRPSSPTAARVNHALHSNHRTKACAEVKSRSV
eukprot:365971-Chlamydomonas_euryale.AAC.6